MKILQLGKFYPIRGGVEKVMWDLTRGLSERGTDCDMLCAELGIREPHIIQMNAHGRVVCLPAKTKKAGTMIAPKMIGCSAATETSTTSSISTIPTRWPAWPCG